VTAVISSIRLSSLISFPFRLPPGRVHTACRMTRYHGSAAASARKVRLVAAGQEIGLKLDTARVHLIRERGYRFVHVGASPEDWPHDTSMVSLARDGCADRFREF
jgi:hypothetical protein